MELNERLARVRKARGLSQEDLASRLGVSRQAVSKWETGDAPAGTFDAPYSGGFVIKKF